MTAVLNRVLAVAIGKTEQVVCEVITGEGTIEVERTLCRREQILDLPYCSKLPPIFNW